MPIEVDISDVLRGLEAMRARGRDLRPVFREVRGRLKDDIAEHFAKQEGPDGRWPGRAQSTIDRAVRAGGIFRKRPLRRGHSGPTTAPTKRGARWLSQQLGRFRHLNVYKIVTTAQSITMQARGAWAGIHQFGGTAGRGARVPERPFLWASEKLVHAFGVALRHFMLGAW